MNTFAEYIDDIQGYSSWKELWGAGKMAQWVEAPNVTSADHQDLYAGRGEMIPTSCPLTNDTYIVEWIPLSPKHVLKGTLKGMLNCDELLFQNFFNSGHRKHSLGTV